MKQNEFIIRCLRCGQKNRIVPEHLSNTPRCGRCGAALDELIIRCMECGTRNLVPEERVSDRPICGKCGAPLYLGSVVEVSDRSFSEEVLAFPGPVLVCFWSDTCESCRVSLPALEYMTHTYAGSIKVVRLKVDDAPETVSRFGITETPSFLLFKNGVERKKLTGPMKPADLKEHLQPLLTDEKTGP